MSDIQQLYLDAIKANAEVAAMNAQLQTDLTGCQAELTAARAVVKAARIAYFYTHELSVALAAYDAVVKARR